MEAIVTDAEEARRALEALNRTQADMAERTAPHWSWGLAYAAVCGLMVGGQGVAEPWNMLSVGLGVSALALLIQRWKDRTGFWVSGVAPRRARWVAIGLGVVMLGLMVLNIRYSGAHGGWIGPVGTGLLAAIAAFVAGELWMRVWRKEIRRGGA